MFILNNWLLVIVPGCLSPWAYKSEKKCSKNLIRCRISPRRLPPKKPEKNLIGSPTVHKSQNGEGTTHLSQSWLVPSLRRTSDGGLHDFEVKVNKMRRTPCFNESCGEWKRWIPENLRDTQQNVLSWIEWAVAGDHDWHYVISFEFLRHPARRFRSKCRGLLLLPAKWTKSVQDAKNWKRW